MKYGLKEQLNEIKVEWVRAPRRARPGRISTGAVLQAKWMIESTAHIQFHAEVVRKFPILLESAYCSDFLKLCESISVARRGEVGWIVRK